MTTASPQIHVCASQDELAEWLSTESGFLEGLGTFDNERLLLDRYQRTFLDYRTGRGRPRFRIVNKSRQVGFSFVMAAESLARVMLHNGHHSIHVSYNLTDAKEKIARARAIYEELPKAYQKKLVVDSKTELVFESHGGRHAQRSRIISNPARAPRGRTGDVYLDELAHVGNDAEVYKGATALILRSGGQLTIASTPLGQRGKFWEIYREELRAYEQYQRFFVPWWYCAAFCEDVIDAAAHAPGVPTEDRVARWGTDGIRSQLESLPIEDFRQEFEGDFVDEAYSFFPYELILPSTSGDIDVDIPFDELPEPKGRLVVGVDVGRVRDLTVIAVFDEVRPGEFEARGLRTLHAVSFADQEEDLRRLLRSVPIARLSIDATGMGRNLAENLRQDFSAVEEVTFTQELKERMATDFKILLQQRRVVLPRDRALVSDVHAVRRKVTPSGNIVFEAERTSAGHADRFWAVALACQIERKPQVIGIRARSI